MYGNGLKVHIRFPEYIMLNKKRHSIKTILDLTFFVLFKHLSSTPWLLFSCFIDLRYMKMHESGGQFGGWGEINVTLV